MDNLDVTDIHYDKKISDLQRRLDTQYDKIDEVEDGNWIRNIKFQFPVPILRDGKEVARVDGISLDNEQFDEHTVSLEKLSTLETVVLLSRKAPV